MIGNSHARLSQERWGCILQAIAPTLQHMESEDFSSGETLFGIDAIKRVKERAEELRTLQSVKNRVCVSWKGDSQPGGPSGCHPQQKGKEPANPHRHYWPKFHPFQSNQKNKIGRIRPSPTPPWKKGAVSRCHGIPTTTAAIPASSEEAGPHSILILPPGQLRAVSRPLDMGILNSPWEEVAPVHALASVFAGRLRIFEDNWRITDSWWVLETVAEGYRLSLKWQ